jgi:hypothetical protein
LKASPSENDDAVIVGKAVCIWFQFFFLCSYYSKIWCLIKLLGNESSHFVPSCYSLGSLYCHEQH